MFKNISRNLKMATAAMMAALVAASALACNQTSSSDNGRPAENSGTPGQVSSGSPIDTEKTTAAPLDTSEPGAEGKGWTSEHFRIAYSESAAKKPMKVINTAEEMKAYFESVAGAKTGDKELREFIEKCDEDFFKTHFLVGYNQTFSSGSIAPIVKSVEVNDGKLVITVGGAMEGDVGTADMATHLCVLLIDRALFSPELPVTVAGDGYYGNTGESH